MLPLAYSMSVTWNASCIADGLEEVRPLLFVSLRTISVYPCRRGSLADFFPAAFKSLFMHP
jgi:hypothetical protein